MFFFVIAEDRYYANEEPIYESMADIPALYDVVAMEMETEIYTETEVATENSSEYDDVVSPIPQKYEAPKTKKKDIYRVSDGMLPSRHQYEQPVAPLKVCQ